MNFINTMKGSQLENFFPSGWDMKKIDECCSNPPQELIKRQAFWHKDFQPESCDNIFDFKMMLGHEIALEIKKTRDEGRKLALILPVGPMGMYRWIVYFLKEWQAKLLSCIWL